jgi:hypothetical protein
MQSIQVFIIIMLPIQECFWGMCVLAGVLFLVGSMLVGPDADEAEEEGKEGDGEATSPKKAPAAPLQQSTPKPEKENTARIVHQLNSHCCSRLCIFYAQEHLPLLPAVHLQQSPPSLRRRRRQPKKLHTNA